MAIGGGSDYASNVNFIWLDVYFIAEAVLKEHGTSAFQSYLSHDVL